MSELAAVAARSLAFIKVASHLVTKARKAYSLSLQIALSLGKPFKREQINPRSDNTLVVQSLRAA